MWFDIPIRNWIIYFCLVLSLLCISIWPYVLSVEWVVEFVLTYRNYHNAYKQEVAHYKEQAVAYANERSHFQGLLQWEQQAHYDTRRKLDQVVSDRNYYHSLADKLSKQMQGSKPR